MKEKKKRFF